MKVTHYDLFAGIGGFSLALDTIFHEQKNEHIFCEWEAFPTAVLKKHWSDATYYGDIADLVTDTDSQRREGVGEQDAGRHGLLGGETPDQKQVLASSIANTNNSRRGTPASNLLQEDRQKNSEERKYPQHGTSRHNLTILTGGFPCQPFSHAGRRQGTADDRYKWPDMFAVIRNVRPDWIIAENVAGINSMVQYYDGFEVEEKEYPTEEDARTACEESHQKGQGYRTGDGVLGTVVGDLEKEGYTVQTFIIPAVAIGAPHRRDRVWIIANCNHTGSGTSTSDIRTKNRKESSQKRKHPFNRTGGQNCIITNTRQQLRKQRSGKRVEADTTIGTARTEANQREHKYIWADDWREVAFATCYDGVDDGVPRRMDGATLRGKRTDTISASQHRKLRLKACGNAIVPQVAMEIFKAIKSVEK